MYSEKVLENARCDYADLFERYTFLDGSPCGKIKK